MEQCPCLKFERKKHVVAVETNTKTKSNTRFQSDGRNFRGGRLHLVLCVRGPVEKDRVSIEVLFNSRDCLITMNLWFFFSRWSSRNHRDLLSREDEMQANLNPNFRESRGGQTTPDCGEGPQGLTGEPEIPPLPKKPNIVVQEFMKYLWSGEKASVAALRFLVSKRGNIPRGD